MFKSTPLNDGTRGYRYSWGLTRKRQARKRYGVANGKTMLGFHTGLRSLYVEKKHPLKPLWNFAAN